MQARSALFPVVFCKSNNIEPATFGFKNDFSTYFYQMVKQLNFWKCLSKELSIMTSPILIRHSPCWSCYDPGNATVKMASWFTGKRTKGGRATLWNSQIVDNRWHLMFKERDWGRRSQGEEPQHIHLEILPRNHNVSINQTYFFIFDESRPDTKGNTGVIRQRIR